MLINALTAQKDYLIACIQQAEDADTLKTIKVWMNFAFAVWSEADYGYKATEIESFFARKAQSLIDDNEKFLLGERKTSRLRAGVDSEIRKLQSCLS